MWSVMTRMQKTKRENAEEDNNKKVSHEIDDVPPCWAVRDPMDIFPGRMSPKDFLKVLEYSLHSDEAVEKEELKSDAEVLVIFKTPLRRIGGLDAQIVQLQNGLKRLSMESCTDRVPMKMLLRRVFDFTKGTYFSKIHRMVINSVRSLVPFEMRAAVNVETTYSFISTLYDDLLQEINTALTEINFKAEVWDDSILNGIMDVARNLLLTTMKKLQDFMDICRLCIWLKASRRSVVNLQDELEAMVSPLSVKAVGAIFQTMLSTGSEGTAEDAPVCSSDARLNDFLQAVADKFKISEGDTSHRTSVEPPVLDSELESCMLATASGVVSALMSDLKSTFEEDPELADHSVDPSLYDTKVQTVSDDVLKDVTAKMKEAVVADMFRRANGALNTEDEAQLQVKLLSASGDILKIITGLLLAVLRSLIVKQVAAGYIRFLQSLQKCLILSSQHHSKSDEDSSEDPHSSNLQSKNSSVGTARRTEEPSTSQAPGTSAAIPYPKRKSLFSRISAAFTKLFCIRCRKSC